jgi:hypothetical protein
MIVEDVIEALPNLPPEKLRDVLQRAKYLLDSSGGGIVEPVEHGMDDQRLVLDAMALVAGNRNPGVSTIMRTKQGKVFSAGVARCMKLVRAEFGALRKVETIKIVRVLVGCVAGDLSRRGVPVCLRTLCAGLNEIEEHVDLNFPGYRRAGLLRFVVGRVNE